MLDFLPQKEESPASKLDKVTRHLKQRSSVLHALPEIPVKQPRPIDDPAISLYAS
jgi:hypothetical protein